MCACKLRVGGVVDEGLWRGIVARFPREGPFVEVLREGPTVKRRGPCCIAAYRYLWCGVAAFAAAT